MLTLDDEPTVRNAIMKRLSLEPGVKLIEVKTKSFPKEDPPCMRVGVLAFIDQNSLIGEGRFDLPHSFDHSHLINEIDEIAENFKLARRDWWARGGHAAVDYVERKTLPGTGTRGRWP